MLEKEEISPSFIHAEKMKIETETIRVSKRRLMGKGMGALLKEGRGRFYILRRSRASYQFALNTCSDYITQKEEYGVMGLSHLIQTRTIKLSSTIKEKTT
ncbi:hypothetical protein CR513_10433, partial [Mucuna pruriens]